MLVASLAPRLLQGFRSAGGVELDAGELRELLADELHGQRRRLVDVEAPCAELLRSVRLLLARALQLEGLELLLFRRELHLLLHHLAVLRPALAGVVPLGEEHLLRRAHAVRVRALDAGRARRAGGAARPPRRDVPQPLGDGVQRRLFPLPLPPQLLAHLHHVLAVDEHADELASRRHGPLQERHGAAEGVLLEGPVRAVPLPQLVAALQELRAVHDGEEQVTAVPEEGNHGRRRRRLRRPRRPVQRILGLRRRGRVLALPLRRRHDRRRRLREAGVLSLDERPAPAHDGLGDGAEVDVEALHRELPPVHEPGPRLQGRSDHLGHLVEGVLAVLEPPRRRVLIAAALQRVLDLPQVAFEP
mmetsp:Transcript_25748/g.80624  ORF Transcript_25748/g.80624 Transcript_25748/m.80624 type:complete len:360 (+) Transcript_25748:44-1123(+)